MRQSSAAVFTSAVSLVCKREREREEGGKDREGERVLHGIEAYNMHGKGIVIDSIIINCITLFLISTFNEG